MAKTVFLNAAATASVKVSQAIINAYVRRIRRGTITIDDVPLSIRAEVQAALDALN